MFVWNYWRYKKTIYLSFAGTIGTFIGFEVGLETSGFIRGGIRSGMLLAITGNTIGAVLGLTLAYLTKDEE